VAQDFFIKSNIEKTPPRQHDEVVQGIGQVQTKADILAFAERWLLYIFWYKNQYVVDFHTALRGKLRLE